MREVVYIVMIIVVGILIWRYVNAIQKQGRQG